jgi:hypothetical protein
MTEARSQDRGREDKLSCKERRRMELEKASRRELHVDG